MNYYDLYECDTRNSKGFSVSLFISGCGMNPKCENCFSCHTWDFNSGKPYTQETEDYIIKCLSKSYIKWFCILGGNPTDNLEGGELLKLVKRIRVELPHIFIACWSGNTYEELITEEYKKEFISELDMLRDGRFIPSLNNAKQFLGGSTNQRYINCSESLKQNKTIEFDLKKERINK